MGEYVNVDPIYQNHANATDAPGSAREVEDYNVPLQFANGETPERTKVKAVDFVGQSHDLTEQSVAVSKDSDAKKSEPKEEVSATKGKANTADGDGDPNNAKQPSIPSK